MPYRSIAVLLSVVLLLIVIAAQPVTAAQPFASPFVSPLPDGGQMTILSDAPRHTGYAQPRTRRMAVLQQKDAEAALRYWVWLIFHQDPPQ